MYYKRGTRVAGESKYPLKKMVSFAVEGVTSFSTKPLSMITGIGLFSVFIGIIMLIYTLVSVFSGHAVAAGAPLCSLCGFLGGFYSASSWNYRRIYRENLHGGQSSTALYH